MGRRIHGCYRQFPDAVLLQPSQNIGERATHLKLDELIRAIEGARNQVASVEERDEDAMDELKQTIDEACEEINEIEAEEISEKS